MYPEEWEDFAPPPTLETYYVISAEATREYPNDVNIVKIKAGSSEQAAKLVIADKRNYGNVLVMTEEVYSQIRHYKEFTRKETWIQRVDGEVEEIE